jgi:hypothetical protein
MSRRKRRVTSAATRKKAMAAVSGIKREPKGSDAVTGKGRKARRGVVVYLHPLAKDALKRIAHEHRKSIQELGIEAFNRLFLEYGEKPIG